MAAEGVPSPRAGRQPLRRREFRLYFAGNLISNTGTWLSNVALGVYMLEITSSSFWVGMVGLGLMLPVLVFALPAGALADRLDRLVLLRRAQLGMATLTVLLAALVALDVANRYVLTAISFGIGVGIAVSIPAMQALIPVLVPHEELPEAIQLNALTFNAARVVGPLLAASALVAFHAGWVFAINAASFFALVWALWAIRRPPFPRERTGAPGSARDALRYAWRHTETRWILIAIVSMSVTLDPITTLSPALARAHDLPAAAGGWIVSSWGTGAALTLLLGRALIRRMTEHGFGWAGLVALAVGVAVMGLADAVPLVLAAGALAGVGYITATMVFTTTIQASVPEQMRGRVMALWTLAFLGPRAFAAVAAGSLADATSARTATAVFSIAALGAALLMRRVRGSRAEPVIPPA